MESQIGNVFRNLSGLAASFLCGRFMDKSLLMRKSWKIGRNPFRREIAYAGTI